MAIAILVIHAQGGVGKGASATMCSGLLMVSFVCLFKPGGDWVGLTSIVCPASLSGRQTEVKGSTLSWEIKASVVAFGQLWNYNEFDCHWISTFIYTYSRGLLSKLSPASSIDYKLQVDLCIMKRVAYVGSLFSL